MTDTAGSAPSGTGRTTRLTSVTAAPVVLSAKGARTRARLLEAAQTVFARDGFLDARIADIALEAGVAHGTFYTYFDSKSEVFQVVIGEVMEQVWHERHAGGVHDADLTPYERIERANRRFVTVFRAHPAMLGLLEQLMTYDDALRALRMEVRDRSVERVRRSIERLQGEGEVAPDLDARLTAAALVSMVSNFCYFWLFMGEQQYDEDAVVATLTRLWASALGIAPA